MSQCHDVYETPLPTGHLPLLVSDLMTTRPVTVEPTATIREIAHTMHAGDIRTVPVVDMGDVLVGVVSEADVICREGYPTVRSQALAAVLGRESDPNRWAQRAEGLTAEEIMTREIVTCAPDESIPVVTRRMLRRNLRSLPVVEGGHLVGIISRHDLLRMFDRPDAEVRWRVDRLLADPTCTLLGVQVEAEVLDGVVVLTGIVGQEGNGRMLSAMLRHVPGVVEVVDRTEVGRAA